jgi:hypothetical protein
MLRQADSIKVYGNGVRDEGVGRLLNKLKLWIEREPPINREAILKSTQGHEVTIVRYLAHYAEKGLWDKFDAMLLDYEYCEKLTLDSSLAELSLSPRVVNDLEEGGFLTIRDVLCAEPWQLLCVRNVGDKIVEEVYDEVIDAVQEIDGVVKAHKIPNWKALADVKRMLQNDSKMTDQQIARLKSIPATAVAGIRRHVSESAVD